MIYQYHQGEQFDSKSAAEILLAEAMPKLTKKHAAFIKKDPEAWAELEDRLHQYLPRLTELYFDLYNGCIEAYPQFFNLIETMTENWVKRDTYLKASDRDRLANPDWFCSNQMIGAVCYVDLFAGDLSGIRKKLPFFKELGITYLHLMPLFKCPEGNNDGGYAVSSYREVDEKLGTAQQLRKLAQEFREAGIALAVDFVFNHTSDEHEWALKAKAGDPVYQNYYWMFDDRSVPDRYESSLREIFPDEHPGAFTWFEDIHKWVWTTFHSYQWDLNYHNPQVLSAIADEMLHLANMGVDILRLDAVAFIWKQMGTVCESLPQAYKLVEVFNLIARISAPSLLFKSEAIVHPDEVIRYIDPALCRLSYNPLLMALMWEALATRETKLLSASMRGRFNLPEHTSWVNYIRCHDDIGWTFSDEDAGRLWINGYPHRQFLNSFYTGKFEGSFAKGLPFQENPHTGDCRISGMLASLAGLEKALAENNETEIQYSLDRIQLLFGIIMFIGGMPLIYLGDEIGELNDYSYTEDPDKKDDSRWVHRVHYDWNAWKKRNDENTVAGTLWNRIKNLIAIRKSHPVFSVQNIEVPLEYNQHIFTFIKRSENETVHVVVNFSEHRVQLPASVFNCFDNAPTDLLTGKEYPYGPFTVEPYQILCLYLKN